MSPPSAGTEYWTPDDVEDVCLRPSDGLMLIDQVATSGAGNVYNCSGKLDSTDPS
jgi:hypothetical protein